MIVCSIRPWPFQPRNEAQLFAYILCSGSLNLVDFEVARTCSIPWATVLNNTYFLPPLQFYWLHISNASLRWSSFQHEQLQTRTARRIFHCLPALTCFLPPYCIGVRIPNCLSNQPLCYPSFGMPSIHVAQIQMSITSGSKSCTFNTSYVFILSNALSTRQHALIPRL